MHAYAGECTILTCPTSTPANSLASKAASIVLGITFDPSADTDHNHDQTKWVGGVVEQNLSGQTQASMNWHV